MILGEELAQRLCATEATPGGSAAGCVNAKKSATVMCGGSTANAAVRSPLPTSGLSRARLGRTSPSDYSEAQHEAQKGWKPADGLPRASPNGAHSAKGLFARPA